MRLRVLMFGWEFPPHNTGGLGVACQGLVRSLARRDVDVTFVLPRKVDVSSDAVRIVFADNPHLRVRSVPSLLVAYVTSTVYTRVRSLESSILYGSTLLEEVRNYARRAREIARDESFDIIHAHDWLSFPAGLAAKAVSGRPLVAHVHSTEFDRTGGNAINQEVYEIERAGMEGADAVTAVSYFTKNIIVNRYGIEPTKVRVVHNGIDADEYHCLFSGSDIIGLKEAGNHVVLFVGRITVQKGPDHFLRAAQRVIAHNHRVFFIIAGSGDMEAQIIEQAASLGIADKVLFPGFLRGEELGRVFQEADVFVMPSVSEPFGLTALESLAHGTPAIISKQSGVAEVVSHALKVDFWDVEEMASNILAVIAYKQLGQCLAENAGREVQQLTWDQAAEKCNDTYRSLLAPSF